MASSSVVTNNGKNTVLNRLFKTSPDYSAIISGAIGTSGATASASDTDLLAKITGEFAGQDYKGYETSYPSFDESNKRVSLRTFVTSTQANGNILREYGDFNGDATPRILGRFTFEDITKTSGIQIYFTPRYVIQD